jgi:hypothetical protein
VLTINPFLITQTTNNCLFETFDSVYVHVLHRMALYLTDDIMEYVLLEW